MKWSLFLCFGLIFLARERVVKANELSETVSGISKIELQIGETKTIRIPQSKDIKVSRKGIVHLVYQSNDKWLVTGIRSGLVILEAGTLGQNQFVFYIKVKTEDESQRLILAEESNFLMDSNDVDRLGGDGLISRENFIVRVKFELEEHSKDVSSPWNHEQSLNASSVGLSNVGLSGLVLNPALSIKLNDKPGSVIRKTIGEPVVRMSLGSKAVVQSGGEVIERAMTRDGTEGGRLLPLPYGMKLGLALVSKDQGSLQLQSKLEVKLPHESWSKYSSGQIESQQFVDINQWTTIGEVELASDRESKSETMTLSQVPIIGPFFKESYEQKSKSRLYFRVLISEAK
jgi:hypothetical protein